MFHRLKEFMNLRNRTNKTENEENEERSFEFEYRNFEEFKQAVSEKKTLKLE